MKTVDPFGDWDARGIYEECSRDVNSDVVGSNMLAERSIVTKYISNVENLPINVEITEDFDEYMKGYGEWCQENAEYTLLRIAQRKMLPLIAGITKVSSSNENVPAQE